MSTTDGHLSSMDGLVELAISVVLWRRPMRLVTNCVPCGSAGSAVFRRRQEEFGHMKKTLL